MREGYTAYSATLEGFARDFEDGEPAENDFPFATEEEAVADAEMVARSTKKKVLIIQKINATNASYNGIGWVYPSGTYSPGI